jgi:hypothetical protein
MPTYYSSGTNAISSTAAGSIALISGMASGRVDAVLIVNGGAVDGQFSLDGGTTWGPMKAYTSMLLENVLVVGNIMVRRHPSGSSDISGVEGWASARW